MQCRLAQMQYSTIARLIPCSSWYFHVIFYWLTRVIDSLRSGYSRIPVHEPDNPLSFIGLLLVKRVRNCSQTICVLLLMTWQVIRIWYRTSFACPSIALVHSTWGGPFNKMLPSAWLFVSPFVNLDYILASSPCSQTGRAHLLLISRTPGVDGGAIGVLTLEGAGLLSLTCHCIAEHSHILKILSRCHRSFIIVLTS